MKMNLNLFKKGASRRILSLTLAVCMMLTMSPPITAAGALASGVKVLLATVNKKPQLYMSGRTMPLPGEVWTVSAEEMSDWYDSNKNGVTDWQVRLHQMVGVPLTSEYTHVTAMLVSPEDVLRPAYSTDLTSEEMPTALPENTPEDYRDWFEGNVMWSYFDSEYPWTRLGYTYDRAENSGEYGLTEFLVREGAEVTTVYTDTIPDYIKRLEQEEH